MSGQKDHPGRIIVKNYPPETSTRDLQIMFEKYGKIDDCEFSRFENCIVIISQYSVINSINIRLLLKLCILNNSS